MQSNISTYFGAIIDRFPKLFRICLELRPRMVGTMQHFFFYPYCLNFLYSILAKM